MMAQYRTLKDQHPDCVLLFRLGDFYEVFFEDAPTVAHAIGLQLTRRNEIPMCGLPWHQLDSYLPQLIQKGFRVALCEQLEDPLEAKKRGPKALVRRDITRIITPGTLTEDTLLSPRSHNYLAAVTSVRGQYGLAWLDLSTGAFHCQPLAAAELGPRLAALEPSEILVPDTLTQRPELFDVWRQWKGRMTIQPDTTFHPANCQARLLKLYQVQSLDAFGRFSPPETAAAGALAAYLDLTQKGAQLSLQPLRQLRSDGVLHIDPATRRSLELTRTLSNERKGSLLWLIDRTITAAGGRLLREHLASPLTDIAVMTDRLDALEWWTQRPALIETLRDILKRAPDLERSLGRLALGRGGPRDLAAIAGGLQVAESLRSFVTQASATLPSLLAAACQNLPVCLPLTARLDEALGPDLPMLARDGGFIRGGFHPRLDELRRLASQGATIIRDLESRYKAETGIATLKIKHNNILGYYIEVTSRFADQMREPFIHRQTMSGAARFTTTELSELQSQLLKAEAEAKGLELQLFDELVTEVLQQTAVLHGAAGALATLDVSSALADLALRQNYVRPEVTTGTDFSITAGRHPVVEAMLAAGNDAPFAPNDACLEDGGRLWVLTGPNMAGKSTFLRQNALIVILMQMGSFVPAKAARIGIVDKLFSRVGAADDLAQGRSTFMVEMVETAAILNQATERSLVILDEIGRGTATYDGLSIAWATLEYLHAHNQCRGLFATHYHELTQLAGQLPHLAAWTMDVRETAQGIVFLHQVKPGQADRSYGIFVAQLAGMPTPVLERAESILMRLEADRASGTGGSGAALTDLPLFTPQHFRRTAGASPVEEALKAINPDALSPKEALEQLYALKEQAKGLRPAA
jgi:DNA mismatch repair protein MutS